MGLLAQSQHFAVLFVALETIAIGFYVLVSYDRNSAFSLEAGIKYLVIGGTNTAILLLGIALLYGIGGNAGLAGASADPLLFSNLGAFLSENSGHPIAQMGVLLVLASVAFKVGLVPFQIWIPDVYQGAPTPTTSLLSVSSKAAGFLVLFLLFDANGAFHAMVDFVFPILVVVTIVSMIYGNITALGYTNVKRLLGMSGVSHASFLMIGVLVWMQTGTVEWVSGSILFYLFAYMLASLSVFGVMSIVSVKEDSAQDLYDYTGLSEQRPMLAGMLAIGLGSLAGIPPLVGFMAKFSLFVAAFKSGLFWLLAAAVISVVISIFYYFKWMREAYFHDPVSDLQLDDTPREPVVFAKANKVDALILITLAVAIVVLGLYPMNLISTWSVF
jgi:NADH-quinone oxidoreductase subunit N